jgi:hypothetical protein
VPKKEQSVVERWEYLTRFLVADVPAARAAGTLSDVEAERLGRYAPQALIPALNGLGEKGWELVHMTPAYVGTNEDVLVDEGGGMRRWTNTYFCVFKRKI